MALERKQAAHRSQRTDDRTPKNNKEESEKTQSPRAKAFCEEKEKANPGMSKLPGSGESRRGHRVPDRNR